MSIDLDTIYSEARGELLDHVRRQAATRTWGIGAVGGVTALILQALTTEPAPGAVLSEPAQLAALLIAAGSLINLVLWSVSLESARDVLRMGAYLLMLEQENKMYRGWEHWAWYRHAEGYRHPLGKIAGDLFFWLALLYLLSAGGLSTVAQAGVPVIAAVVLSTSLGCLVAGVYLRLYTHRYRKTALNQIADNWSEERDWFDVVRQRLAATSRAGAFEESEAAVESPGAGSETDPEAEREA